MSFLVESFPHVARLLVRRCFVVLHAMIWFEFVMNYLSPPAVGSPVVVSCSLLFVRRGSEVVFVRNFQSRVIASFPFFVKSPFLRVFPPFFLPDLLVSDFCLPLCLLFTEIPQRLFSPPSSFPGKIRGFSYVFFSSFFYPDLDWMREFVLFPGQSSPSRFFLSLCVFRGAFVARPWLSGFRFS